MNPQDESQLDFEALYIYWQEMLGPSSHDPKLPWDIQCTLLAGLGLNIMETSRYLHNTRPSFQEFQSWILELNSGHLTERALGRLRSALDGAIVGSPIGSLDAVEGLSAADLAHWDTYGYVVVKNAVAEESARAAEAAIYQYLEMDANNPDSWYSNRVGHSIWVPLLRHPTLLETRFAPRLVKAFSQLWGREDLWATVDQAGLNPPERPGWLFPGPRLHWDTTLARPHYFGIQGILYLADTQAEQGAFCCIPGFHKRLGEWLDGLPAGADPREEALRTLIPKPIAAGRGDLVLWHHSLPHGSSPNRATRPRVVQYISMKPTRWQHNSEWV